MSSNTFINGANVILNSNTSDTSIVMKPAYGKTLTVNATNVSSTNVTTTNLLIHGSIDIATRPSAIFTAGTQTTTGMTTSATWTQLTFANAWTSSSLQGSGITFGSASMTDGSLKVTQAGFYLASAEMGFDVDTGGCRGLAVYTNGTATSLEMARSANTQRHVSNVCTPLNLAANDVIKVYSFHDAGHDLAITGVAGGYFRLTKM